MPHTRFVPGRAILVSDENRFRHAFRRFKHDRLNGWSPQKHALRGQVMMMTRDDDKLLFKVLVHTLERELHRLL